MKYSKKLRKMFEGIELNAWDLLLLESFQVAYLPHRVPRKEFATLIYRYPKIKELLILKDRSIESYFDLILEENREIGSEEVIRKGCEEALWEIADLIVYNKFPELYDEKVPFLWTIGEIVGKEALKGKVIADVGAGSGKLSFLLAEHAETVFAIEPVSSFRTFMKQKVCQTGIKNLFVMDGFLESIPMPKDSLDMLFTSNAIGWNIEKELREIERVLKRNGLACHMMVYERAQTKPPLHDTLVSENWKYEFSQSTAGNRVKAMYVKTFN